MLKLQKLAVQNYNQLKLRQLVLPVFICFSLGATSFQLNAKPTKPATGQPPAATQIAPSNQPKLNVVAQAVKKYGIVNCLPHVDTVANFLTKGSQLSGVTLFLPPQAPNQQVTSASFEIETPQAISYASADFAPIAGGCNSTYETVTYWQSTCQDIGSKVYGQLKPMGVIRSSIKILNGGGQLRIFLVPAGIGCIAIKKEVVF